MLKPLISICIPAYRAERYLPETLESIRVQVFKNWELIVVEDGSHDETEALVRRFSDSVSQSVSFMRHGSNQGLPATRNACISRSAAPYIALLDADDLWKPEHLDTLICKANGTNADLVHSGVDLFNSETGVVFERRAPSPADFAEYPRSLFVGRYVIQPSSVLMRRSLCQSIGGFDPQCRYVEDREFWLRFVRAGGVVEYSGSVTCRYRKHINAMSSNAAEMAVGVAKVFERNADWSAMPLGLRRRSTAEGWCSAGRIVLRSDPRLARNYFGRALRHEAHSPRLLTYWLVALLLSFAKRP
jgi:glycosyltransferase involved in cell wall biosynthesis